MVICKEQNLSRLWLANIVDHLFLICSILQAVHKLSEYLSFQVRNIAKELVDAFDLPDHVIRAPIGMQSTTEAYSQYTQYVGF